MVNMFIVKRMGAICFSAMTTTIGFYIGFTFFGFIYAFVGLGIGLILSLIIGSWMLTNPFTAMLEGQGLLAMDESSTGIIQPFIVKMQTPYIRGKLNGVPVEDVFDRAVVRQLAPPIKIDRPAQIREDDDGLHITLSKEAYNRARFQLYHYPTILWNSQLNCLMTKDFLAEQEKIAFAEHGILYLNRKVEETSQHIRDFARYVIQTLKPHDSFLKSAWFWIIIVIFVVIFGAMLMPQIIKMFSSNSGSVATAVSQAKNTITPVG